MRATSARVDAYIVRLSTAYCYANLVVSCLQHIRDSLIIDGLMPLFADKGRVGSARGPRKARN